jgi:hypothetical protein
MNKMDPIKIDQGILSQKNGNKKSFDFVHQNPSRNNSTTNFHAKTIKGSRVLKKAKSKRFLGSVISNTDKPSSDHLETLNTNPLSKR